MKVGMGNIEELMQRILNENVKKRDFISPASKLTMTDDGKMVVADKGEFDIWDTAHDQIGNKLDIPAKYYDRMMKEAPDLLAANVNGWLHKSNKTHTVRTLDTDMRAFLSDRYRPLDNFDLLGQSIIPVIQPILSSLDVASCELTHKRMYIKMVNEKLNGEIKKGDIVQAGMVISNSEVGMGSVQIQPLIMRLACLNGAIMQDSSIRKYHVGGRIVEGDGTDLFYSDSTRMLADKAFFAQVRDVMSGVLQYDGFYALIRRLQDTANNHINRDIDEVMEVAAKKFTLGKSESEGVLKAFINGGDLTQWGLGNAVTQYSQEVESYDRATELERIGGEIFEMSKSSWKELAA